jgi:hypothetical protein
MNETSKQDECNHEDPDHTGSCIHCQKEDFNKEDFIKAAKEVTSAPSHPGIEDAFDSPFILVSRNDWLSAKAVACAYLALTEKKG